MNDAFDSDTLRYVPCTPTRLDESIDFNRDAAAGGQDLRIFKSVSENYSPSLPDKHLRKAMQDDANLLVERLKTTYLECEENNVIRQVEEMIEYLVVENQSEILGVTPEAL